MFAIKADDDDELSHHLFQWVSRVGGLQAFRRMMHTTKALTALLPSILPTDDTSVGHWEGSCEVCATEVECAERAAALEWVEAEHINPLEVPWWLDAMLPIAAGILHFNPDCEDALLEGLHHPEHGTLGSLTVVALLSTLYHQLPLELQAYSGSILASIMMGPIAPLQQFLAARGFCNVLHALASALHAGLSDIQSNPGVEAPEVQLALRRLVKLSGEVIKVCIKDIAVFFTLAHELTHTICIAAMAVYGITRHTSLGP